VFAFDRTVSRLLEMQADEYTGSFYADWLQRRQMSVVSALMDAVAAEASEEAHKTDQERGGPEDAVELLSSIDSVNTNELTPNFIIDSLSADTLKGSWESYLKEHSESRMVSAAVDGPALFVRALETHTGKYEDFPII
jgi:hypothetical protein